MTNLVGKVFGRWTVKSLGYKKFGKRHWWCKCSCGAGKLVQGSNLTSGASKSCGCFSRERRPFAHRIHGLSKHPLFSTWTGMRQRCYDENHVSYEHYGGRGIRVCFKWLCDFRHFLTDMGDKPGAEYSIDRIDPDGPYAAWNCRWATPQQQVENRRATVSC